MNVKHLIMNSKSGPRSSFVHIFPLQQPTDNSDLFDVTFLQKKNFC